MNNPLVTGTNLTVYYADTPVFIGVDIAIHPEEHAVLIGPNGAGKSTLLQLLAGEMRLSQIPFAGQQDNGNIVWNFTGEPDSSALAPKNHCRLISPQQQGVYVRQGWKSTGEQIILSGFDNTPLLYGFPDDVLKKQATHIAASVELEHLLPMQAHTMSQGQLRAILIMRALITKPALLLLDEPLDGLDARTRQSLALLMQKATEHGCTILLTAHRKKDVPAFIKKFIVLKKGKAQSYDSFPTMANEELVFTPAIEHFFQEQKKHISFLLAELSPSNKKISTKALSSQNAVSEHFCEKTTLTKKPLVALENVCVFIDRQPILHNVSWVIQQGEHWIVTGTNGAGKSTLLRLLHGEEFSAFGGEITWFGKTSYTLSQLQKDIGCVSDRLQHLYSYDMSATDVILSGADGSIGLYRDMDITEQSRAQTLKEFLGITAFEDTPFHSLSSGQGRRVLLARALMSAPALLLLDEPFSGLDQGNRLFWRDIISLLASYGTHIVLVSHHETDHLPLFTHVLSLEKGCATITQRA